MQENHNSSTQDKDRNPHLRGNFLSVGMLLSLIAIIGISLSQLGYGIIVGIWISEMDQQRQEHDNLT
jgi:hypothetical protein